MAASDPKSLDPRLEGIVGLLVTLASGDHAARWERDGAQDELAAIGQGLNMLAQELQSKTVSLHEYQRVNEALKESHERQRRYLREKEVLIQELHHRVKNNMQLITSMLGLQARMETDLHTRERLLACQHRTRAMVLAHEQLYQRLDIDQLDFADYLRRLIRNLSMALTDDRIAVALEPDIELPVLDLRQAIPSGLIVNELITNSIQHAFPDGARGEVIVAGGFADGRITLRVSDDGCGLPPSDRHQRSLGTALIRALVRQLDGEISVESGAEGTRAVVNFPLIGPQG